jgi:LPS export ABC transporter protein LptC
MYHTEKKIRLPRMWSIFLSAGLLLIPFLQACHTEKDQEKVLKILQDSVHTERAETVEIRFSDSGELNAILYASVMERFPVKEPYTVFPEGINGFFYGKNGKVDNNVKAGYAISQDQEKTVELRNNVQLVNVKKEKLNTEKLIWDQKTRKIYTDQFVKITTPDNIIYGNGLEADQNFSEYRIFDVKGVVSVTDDAKSN